METNRNDLIYGQNWIDQAMRFRRRFAFNHFYESNYHHVHGMMESMGARSEGRIYRQRGDAFHDSYALNNYVLVR